MIQRLYLILKETFSNRIISIIVLFTVLVSVFSFGIFEIINANVTDYVQRRFAGSIPPNTIHVFPKQPGGTALFSFRRNRRGTISGGDLYRIRRMKNVKVVYPLLNVSVPMQASIPVIGRRIDPIAAVGAPYRLIRKDLKSRRMRTLWRKATPGSVLPVLIPQDLIKAYNVSMASSNVMPWISPKGARGLPFQIRFGQSGLRTLPDYVDESAFIAGFATTVDPIAIIVPMKVAEAYNRKYNSPYRREFYSLYVTVRNHRSLLNVSRAIKRMGFEVETETGVSRSIIQLQRNITLITNSLKYLIVFLSIVAVCFSTIIATFNRLDYYRVMRIVGASKVFITMTIMIKYMALGLVGTGGGLYLISHVIQEVTGFFQLTGIIVTIDIPDPLRRDVLFYGILFPVFSTVPALIRLYTKGLNRD